MPEPKRVVRPEALDATSDHLAELLRRADELLIEWSRFGAGVRAQVDREAQQLGTAVGDAVELAVRRATAEGTARAITEQLAAQLAAVTAEVAKLETRARAASRAVVEQRRGDRVVLGGLIAAVMIANVLLVIGLLRSPQVVEVPVAAPPVPVIVPAPEVSVPVAPTMPDATSGADPKPEPAPAEVKPVLKAVPPPRPVRQGPPTGAR